MVKTGHYLRIALRPRPYGEFECAIECFVPEKAPYHIEHSLAFSFSERVARCNHTGCCAGCPSVRESSKKSLPINKMPIEAGPSDF